MATSVLNTVNTHEFGRDPLWIVLDGAGVVDTGGGLADYTFEFLLAASNGDIVVLTIGTTEYTFTCATTPDDSGWQFSPSGSVNGSATNFESCLKLNPVFTGAYEISRTLAEITLLARAFGPAYNIAVDSTPSGILGNLTGTAGISTVLKDNYRVALRIWFTDQGPTQRPVLLSAAPKLVGYNTPINISSVLRAQMRNATWPTRAMANALYCDYNVIYWYAQAYEVYGTPPTPAELIHVATIANPKAAWYATMRHEERDRTQTFLDECTGNSSKKHPFLTWRGRGGKREVTLTEQHVLGWYMWASSNTSGQVKMQARVTFATGLSTTWTDRYTNGDPSIVEGRIGIFPAGWDELDLAALVGGGDTPVKYELRLYGVGSSTVISEVKTFWLAPEDYNEVHIEFENSLGIVETLRCKGAWEMGAEAEHELLQRTIAWDNSFEHVTERIQEPLGTQRTLTASSGFMPRTELFACLDILHSREIRYFDRERNRLLGATINKATARIVGRGNGNEHLYALNIELQVGDPTNGFGLAHLI